MKWKKYTVHTTTEAEDLVSMMLMELGVEGVQIEDNVPLSDADTKGMFIDILPELAPDDGTSRLSFFLHVAEDKEADAGVTSAGRSDAADSVSVHAGISAAADTGEDNSYSIADRIWTEEEISELIRSIREQLDEMRAYTDIGEGRIEEGVTEDTDWRDNWKKYFKPIKTGSFLIKPTWEQVPEEYKEAVADESLKLIEIDPGTAFGTGSHETTQLCLRAIENYIKSGDTFLDIGTGSGILGIAALKEGAAMVTATELDEQCEPSIHDNLGFNDISKEQFELYIGNVIGDDETIAKIHERAAAYNAEHAVSYGVNGDNASETAAGTADDAAGVYDVVIANILAPVICMLAGNGTVDSFIKKDGIFITSGIIDEKLEDVKQAFAANPAWRVAEINTQGEWCSVVARRV